MKNRDLRLKIDIKHGRENPANANIMPDFKVFS
jgi:hypothetical protein